MKETQENIDRLAIIISDYVKLYEVGIENLDVLNKLYEQLHISPELSGWWKDRFSRAYAAAENKNKTLEIKQAC